MLRGMQKMLMLILQPFQEMELDGLYVLNQRDSRSAINRQLWEALGNECSSVRGTIVMRSGGATKNKH
jgi:hypothetical protein